MRLSNSFCWSRKNVRSSVTFRSRAFLRSSPHVVPPIFKLSGIDSASMGDSFNSLFIWSLPKGLVKIPISGSTPALVLYPSPVASIFVLSPFRSTPSLPALSFVTTKDFVSAVASSGSNSIDNPCRNRSWVAFAPFTFWVSPAANMALRARWTILSAVVMNTFPSDARRNQMPPTAAWLRCPSSPGATPHLLELEVWLTEANSEESIRIPLAPLKDSFFASSLITNSLLLISSRASLVYGFNPADNNLS